jgi:hypothetical protein
MAKSANEQILETILAKGGARAAAQVQEAMVGYERDKASMGATARDVVTEKLMLAELKGINSRLDKLTGSIIQSDMNTKEMFTQFQEQNANLLTTLAENAREGIRGGQGGMPITGRQKNESTQGSAEGGGFDLFKFLFGKGNKNLLASLPGMLALLGGKLFKGTIVGSIATLIFSQLDEQLKAGLEELGINELTVGVGAFAVYTAMPLISKILGPTIKTAGGLVKGLLNSIWGAVDKGLTGGLATLLGTTVEALLAVASGFALPLAGAAAMGLAAKAVEEGRKQWIESLSPEQKVDYATADAADYAATEINRLEKTKPSGVPPTEEEKLKVVEDARKKFAAEFGISESSINVPSTDVEALDMYREEVLNRQIPIPPEQTFNNQPVSPAEVSTITPMAEDQAVREYRNKLEGSFGVTLESVLSAPPNSMGVSDEMLAGLLNSSTFKQEYPDEWSMINDMAGDRLRKISKQSNNVTPVRAAEASGPLVSQPPSQTDMLSASPTLATILAGIPAAAQAAPPVVMQSIDNRNMSTTTVTSGGSGGGGAAPGGPGWMLGSPFDNELIGTSSFSYAYSRGR